jgi:hypothetical protein
MPLGVSDLVVAGSVVFSVVVIGWIIAKVLDRRNDVLHYIHRDHGEP